MGAGHSTSTRVDRYWNRPARKRVVGERVKKWGGEVVGVANCVNFKSRKGDCALIAVVPYRHK